jgi:hypothetical protein
MDHETAIHEAGHAVMARALGAVITHIAPAAHNPELPATAVASCHIFLRQGLRPTDWASVCCAGFAAERRVNPQCTLHGEDLADFNAHTASPAVREAVIARTEATIAARWNEVEQLAAELMKCDGLYTEELTALGYWSPKPGRDFSQSAMSRALRG